tara:strand:+ start:613 stop:855 length:243 start_codon:yes stop_codon:yes gene_type:complete
VEDFFELIVQLFVDLENNVDSIHGIYLNDHDKSIPHRGYIRLALLMINYLIINNINFKKKKFAIAIASAGNRTRGPSLEG